MNTNDTSNWTKAEQIAYLFLCIANSDYNISDREIEIIRNKLDELFGTNTEHDAIIRAAKKIVNNQNEYTKTETIRKIAPFVAVEPALKDRFLVILEEIMNADYQIQSVERIMFRFIKKSLETPL